MSRVCGLSAALLLSVVFCFGINFSQASDSVFPFQPGEKLHFQLRWGAIPAGEAVLEVLPMENISGVEAYHFVLTAKSNSFVDIFFKVRDRIEAYADAEMNHSLFYKKDQHEGKTRRNIEVVFDWDKMEASYDNSGKEFKQTPLMAGSFDPLSIFYYSRTVNFRETDGIERPVTDGKRNVIGVATLQKGKKLELKSGTFDTVLMEPDLKHVKGVFEKSKKSKMQIWFTDDEHRIPVMLKSKVVVGSFVAELVAIEGRDGIFASNEKQ
jgi:hypothetical protein